MAKATHTYQEIVEALQPHIKTVVRIAPHRDLKFYLTEASYERIVVTRVLDGKNIQEVDFTDVIHYIINTTNLKGVITATEIRQFSNVAKNYPLTIKAVCEISLLFICIGNDDWRLAYRETYDDNLSISAMKNTEGNVVLPEDSKTETRDESIRSFYIKNYKNIPELQLQDLKRVNLFVGANNAGKSNLLEAVSLYITNFSPDRMLSILRERGENTEYFEQKYTSNYIEESELLKAFAPFAPQRKVDFFIENDEILLGKDDVDPISFKLQTAVIRSDRELQRLYRLQEYHSLTANQQFVNQRETVLVSRPVSVYKNSSAQTSDFDKIYHMIKLGSNGIEMPPTGATMKTRCKFQYIDCKLLNTDNIEDLWASYSMTEMEQTILEALRIVDDRIVHFNFLKIDSHKYVPWVQLNDGDDYIKMPITEMGDGMRHILNIIVALLGCANGVLLLDEAESGLHYRTQTILWKMLNNLAKDFNVQIFATTHSLDCVRAFASSTTNDLGKVIRIEKQDNKVVAQSYRSLESVVNFINESIEIR